MMTTILKTLFQSTPSARRATGRGRTARATAVFQSTPSARRATITVFIDAMLGPVSIHALRTEGDTFWGDIGVGRIAFQSTPSARRATKGRLVYVEGKIVSIHALRTEGDGNWQSPSKSSAVSIHALRTEGDAAAAAADFCCVVSIHALRTEGDCLTSMSILLLACFNPRPPHGGRRLSLRADVRSGQVSIHALRTEGDALRPWRAASCRRFNPRPPHGGRRAAALASSVVSAFQSTPSARRATNSLYKTQGYCSVSIHALRTEGDPSLF